MHLFEGLCKNTQIAEPDADRAPGDDKLIAAAQHTQADTDNAASGDASRHNTPATDTAMPNDAPPSSAQLEAIHMASLRHAMRGMARLSVHQTAERVIRLRDHARTVMAKTRALAQAVFDRYAVRFMRDQEQERER